MSHPTSPRYAVSLDLHGRRAVVVGGGCVAARRAADLVNAGAVVDLVSPSICDSLRELLSTESLTWWPRAYLSADLDTRTPAERVWLVHVATDDPDVNAQVARDADALGVWCIRADSAADSAAWRPAVGRGSGRADGVDVAVTASADPRRAASIRDAIVEALDEGVLPVSPVRRSTLASIAPVA